MKKYTIPIKTDGNCCDLCGLCFANKNQWKSHMEKKHGLAKDGGEKEVKSKEIDLSIRFSPRYLYIPLIIGIALMFYAILQNLNNFIAIMGDFLFLPIFIILLGLWSIFIILKARPRGTRIMFGLLWIVFGLWIIPIGIILQALYVSAYFTTTYGAGYGLIYYFVLYEQLIIAQTLIMGSLWGLIPAPSKASLD